MINKNIRKNLLVYLAVTIPLLSQEKLDITKTETDSTETKPTIKSLTKGSKSIGGLFTFFQDTTNGSVQMLSLIHI